MSIADTQIWNAFSRADAYYHTVSWDAFRHPGEDQRDQYWASGETQIRELLHMAGVDLRPAHTALEIGSGLGRLTRALAARCAHAYGIDLSPEMVDRADREAAAVNMTNVTFLVGDGRSLSAIGAAQVDLVLSYSVFQHLSRRVFVRGYIQEMARVLRRGGSAIFQCPTWRWRSQIKPGLSRGVQAAGILARPRQTFWQWRSRRAARQRMRDLHARLLAGDCREWSEDDLVAAMKHPARQMKAIYLPRLRCWLNDAGFVNIRFFRPGETYTTVVAQLPG